MTDGKDQEVENAGGEGLEPKIVEAQTTGGETLDQAGIDSLLNQLSENDGAAATGTEEPPPGSTEFNLPEVDVPADTSGAVSPKDQIALLKDVNVKVKVELGRGAMFLREILRLTQGSVVELDKLAGDPLDVYVNDRLIAKGEVLVLNENFCIRITEIFSPREVLRLKG